VRRDELIYPFAERSTRRGNDVTLGRATIGNDGVWAEIGLDAGKNLRHLSHRRRHQHDVGLFDFMRRVDPGPVNDAKFLGDAQGRWRAAKTDHLLDSLSLLERQREGAANQAGTKDDDFAEFSHLERLLQRLQEARVFRLGAYRHAQPFGQTVATNRANDDALLQQLLIDQLPIAHLEGDKIAVRWNMFQPKALQPGNDCAMPAGSVRSFGQIDGRRARQLPRPAPDC
jgi:hypothetical protein